MKLHSRTPNAWALFEYSNLTYFCVTISLLATYSSSSFHICHLHRHHQQQQNDKNVAVMMSTMENESGRKFICRILFHLYEMTLMTIFFFGLLHIQITPYNLQGMSKESYQLRVKTMPAPLIKTGSVDVFCGLSLPHEHFQWTKRKSSIWYCWNAAKWKWFNFSHLTFDKSKSSTLCV